MTTRADIFFYVFSPPTVIHERNTNLVSTLFYVLRGSWRTLQLRTRSRSVFILSVNNSNSGDGKETLIVKFEHDLEISFNSRYLIDVASQLIGDNIELFLNDTGSPALIKDPGDYDSIFVVMPMKG